MYFRLLFVFALFQYSLTATANLTADETEITDTNVDNFQNRVYNGHEVYITQHPYLVRIKTFKSDGKYICTGSLISHIHVLTAAHCVSDGVLNITLTMGLYRHDDKDPWGLVMQCSNCWIVHPYYMMSTSSNYIAGDIALIRLPQYVCFTDRISAIPLPSYAHRQYDLNGLIGTVVGWGHVNFQDGDKLIEKFPSYPMAVQAKIINQGLCGILFSATNNNYDPEHAFCTLHLKTGSCSGDSGGPFLISGTLFGTVRGGTNKDMYLQRRQLCDANYADDYIDITKFLEWIDKNSDVRIGLYQNTFFFQPGCA